MMRLKKIKGKRRSKNATTDSMLGQKSGTALAGPAAPVTTALFFPLAIVQWNALPESVACLQSIEVFKTAVCNTLEVFKTTVCNTLTLRSKFSCFYLILANLNYFNLSSVFILPLLMLLNLSLPFLFLSDTNTAFTLCSRRSRRPCFRQP